MRKLKVLIYPDARLRKKAAPVTELTPEICEIGQEMLKLMYEENGVGLASTQVGVEWRMMTVDVSETHDEPQVLINPRITARIGQVLSAEGCLSFPGIHIEIPRAEKIQIEAIDLTGKLIKIEAEGLLSRCLQHEMDHLDGIFFTDHLSPIKRQRALRAVLQYIEKQEKGVA